MGGKGGSSTDPSGMYAAMASAQAAQEAYSLGEQQLQWAKDVWNQEQPLVTQAEQTQIALAQQQMQAQQQAQAESQAQWNMYQQYFQPIQIQAAQEAQDWASPQAMALYPGMAEASTAENVASGINTAKEALINYGVNPSAPEMSGMYIGANVMGAAAEAATGTTEASNLRNQQIQLEQSAAGMGSNIAGQSGQLTQVETGAGATGGQLASGAAGTAQSNLSTGSSAFTAPVNWFNSGATNMSVYTNAVNQYNQQNYQRDALAAQEAGTIGSAFGDVLGLISPIKIAAKGGPIEKYQEGGNVPSGPTGLPPPPGGTPGGFITPNMSPSGGQQTDDVDAKLTVGEFVMPKDVVHTKGTDFFYKVIDSARSSNQQNEDRNDVGGEQVSGIPTGPPAFVSRPQGAQQPSQQLSMPPQGMPPQGLGLQGMRGGGIPARPMLPNYG